MSNLYGNAIVSVALQVAGKIALCNSTFSRAALLEVRERLHVQFVYIIKFHAHFTVPRHSANLND